jgi:hypothetical protein
MKRIRAAEKARDEWESRYEVVRCRNYWAGLQREDDADAGGERKAIVNRIMPTLRTRIPSLYFYYPFARVVASPSKSDTPGATVDDKAQLLQDTANALLRDPRCGLKEQTLISLKEAHWAFGCIEVGYSADFIDNPALKDAAPPLQEDKDTEGVEPYKKIVKEEWFWTRRIPPRQIIVSAPESTVVEENDWIGYWEFQNVEDVKKAPAYSNTRELKGSGSDEKKEGDTDTGAQDVRLYKVWDLRTKCRYVFAEGHDKPLLKQDYERLPLFFLRFEVEPDRFRPIPPIYGWLGAQDEYNDSREFLRLQRKTRVPRYTVAEGGVLPEEMQKFEDNEPNVWIKRLQNTTGDVISPVMQPNMSDSALQSLTLSRQEFDEVTGVGAESRQQASSGTATQAAIMNQRQTINDSFDRALVADWLGKIARELVLLAIDKMTLPRWIQLNSDPYSPMFQQDAMNIANQYQQITLQELQNADSDLRWDVSIDVESLSPVSEQEKQAQWMQILTVISNPAVAPLLAMSPELLKRTLDLNGVKNAKDQAAIGMALQAQAQMQAQMAQAKMGGPPGVAPMGGQPTGPGGPGPTMPQPPQMIPGPSEGMVQ